MKKLFVLVLALAAVASACSSSDEIVAAVNGVEIQRSAVNELAPDGDDPRPSDFLQYLTVRIQWEALSQAALADYGIAPSDEEIGQRLDDLVAGQGAGATLEDYLEATEASEAGIREFTRQLIIQDEILAQFRTEIGPADESAVTAELEDFPLDWTVVCVSHILVATEVEANDVLGRLAAGETFADIAFSTSIDAQSGAEGGALGCGAPSDFSDEIAQAAVAADVDVPVGPVESEFGFHILLVTQREVATPEIVKQAIEREAVNAATEEWFTVVVQDADITVSEDVGTWTTDPTPQILPNL